MSRLKAMQPALISISLRFAKGYAWRFRKVGFEPALVTNCRFEHRGFYPACPFDLDKKSICTCPRKAVRKRDFFCGDKVVAVCRSVRPVRQFHGSHRRRTAGVQMCEHRRIIAYENQMSWHSHVRLQIGCRLT